MTTPPTSQCGFTSREKNVLRLAVLAVPRGDLRRGLCQTNKIAMRCIDQVQRPLGRRYGRKYCMRITGSPTSALLVLGSVQCLCIVTQAHKHLVGRHTFCSGWAVWAVFPPHKTAGHHGASSTNPLLTLLKCRSKASKALAYMAAKVLKCSCHMTHFTSLKAGRGISSESAFF